MDENKKKEAISTNLISILAHNQGFKVNEVTPDDGIDIRLSKTITVKFGKDNHIVDTETCFDIQLKSAGEKQITYKKDCITYSLKNSNYNKLALARKKRKFIPYILILYIFPDDCEEWLKFEPESFLVAKAAYWYYPRANAKFITNKPKNYKTRIVIPKKNKLSKQSLNDIYNGFKKNHNL